MNLFHDTMVAMGRHRLILDRQSGEEYMDRYYLFLKDRHSFPFNVTLHKIKKSDDPIFHDHPWSYTTIILSGGYHEHTPVFGDDGRLISQLVQWRGPGSIIHRKATEFHWLELENNIPTVSLFFMGRQCRKWGFLVPNVEKRKHEWIESEEYLESRSYA
jgi:hypothetical protein